MTSAWTPSRAKPRHFNDRIPGDEPGVVDAVEGGVFLGIRNGFGYPFDTDDLRLPGQETK